MGRENGDTVDQVYIDQPMLSITDGAYSGSGNLAAGQYTLTVSAGTSGLGYATNFGLGSLVVNAKKLLPSTVLAGKSTTEF